MCELIKSGVAVALVLGATAALDAQVPMMPSSAIRADDAAALATGWTLVAQGKHVEAAQLAAQVLARNPRSMPACSLLIEPEIARAGATTALGTYESWLGARTLEEPGILRRIAFAMLYEFARQDRDTLARAESLNALVAEGDPDAVAVVTGPATGISQTDERMLAALGNGEAIERVATQLKTTPGLKLRDIRALGDSRSPKAVAALMPVLADPMPQNRAEAAEALGKLGKVDAIAPLKKLLNDEHGQVRLTAAGALFRLGDATGEPMLRELAASDKAVDRRSAALLLAPRPDDAWLALVRSLAFDHDPIVRLEAARLIAAHDPAYAMSIFDGLRADPNVAIREETELALAQSPVSGFAAARQFLRATSGLVKVRAAARLLVLTR